METLLADYTLKDQILIFCKQRKTLAREVWLWKLLTIKDENNDAAVYVYVLPLSLLIITFTIFAKKIELNF